MERKRRPFKIKRLYFWFLRSYFWLTFFSPNFQELFRHHPVFLVNNLIATIFIAGHMLHASFMASPQGGVSAHYSGYAGYTPPPGAYNIHQHYQQPQHVDQRSSDSPLDFSAAASQYGNNSSAWNDEMRNYEDNKVIGFSDVNPSNGVDRTSSPDYRYVD